jgi:ADP-ribose pyrophosphatase YjhB (NUDIX family)
MHAPIANTRLTDQEYDFVYSRVPRTCVDLVIKNSEGVLLSLRQIEPYKGLWHFPGGRVMFNETIEEATQRISLAELGVEVTIDSMAGYIDIFEGTKESPRHSISIALFVTPKSKDIKGSWQAEKFKVFKKLPENMHPDHGKFLREHNIIN